MGRDYDWSDTDRLVEQLRAKLAEDPDFLSDPDKPIDLKQEPAKSPAVGVRDEEVLEKIRAKKEARREARRQSRERAAARAVAKEQAPVEEAAPAVEAAPVEEAAPAAQEIPAHAAVFVEDPAPVKEAPAPARNKRAERKKKEEQPAAPAEAETPAEQPRSAEPRRRIYRAGSAPTSSRNGLFASAYRRDEDDYVARPVLTGKRSANRRVEAKLPVVEEIGAEEAVDNILQDLFGAANEWFTEREPKAYKGPEQVVELTIADDPTPAPAEEKPAEEPAPEIAVAAPAEESVEEDDLLTLTTREQDGQLSLALPETEVTPEPPVVEERTVHRKTLEEKLNLSDDGQIDLFSMLSMEERIALNTVSDDADSAERLREMLEFKQSVESSKEDFQLLMDLDYENELGQAIGFEKIREYHEEGVNGPAVDKSRRRRLTDKTEFEFQGQDTALRKRYTQKKRDHLLRLIVSLSLTVILFFYESFNLFGAIFGGPFDRDLYPDAYTLLGIQLLVVIAFFSRQRLWKGLVRLVRFSPIDCSLCSVMLLATLVYHVALLFLPVEGVPALYLSPAAVSITLLTLSDLLNWYRESHAFQVVSSRKQKYALIPRVSVGGKEGNARRNLEEDDGNKRFLYACPVDFVRNYFANTQKRIAHSRTLGAQLLLILSVASAAALFVFALGADGSTTLRTLFIAFLFCAPTASLLVTALPMAMATKLRLRNSSAIIGEDPIYESAASTTLVMPDTDVFAPMYHERFELVEDCDEQQVTVLVRGLLDKLKSPLRNSVSVDRDLLMDEKRIELVEIDEGGVSAMVDGECSVLMGNMKYMQKYGIRVQPRAGGDYEDICRRLVCVAVDHKVSALFLARYRLDDKTVDLLRELEEEDVQIMVRSKDPGVHGELMERLLPDRKERVAVMKPSANEIELSAERVDATVVSLLSCKEAARTFITCRRIRRARHFGNLFQALSVGVGALAVGLCATLSGAVAIPSFLVSLYLTFWCGLHAATSYFYLREKKDD